MGALRYAFGAQYKRFYNNLKVIAKRDGRCAPAMFLDAAFCTIVYGTGLSDYLNYELHKKSRKQRREYVSIRDQDNFYAKVSPEAYKKTFSVKPNFFKAFAKYVGRSCFLPESGSRSELAAFLAENQSFMEKPVDGLGGKGVVRKYSRDISDPAEYLAYLTENRLFLEQYIIQHERMAALCPRSVNTLRIMTSTTSGTPKIIGAYLRVGGGENDVDNFHGGGMAVEVDVGSGKLMGSAVDKALNRFDDHPKTGVHFDGYQIPCFEDVKHMVCEAAMVEPRIMVIGWDVAITPNGPVFVEGNRRPGFDLPQVVAGHGRKDMIRTALDELRQRERGK